jgi:hypothetical protein
LGVKSQPGLHREILSQNKTKQKTNKQTKTKQNKKLRVVHTLPESGLACEEISGQMILSTAKLMVSTVIFYSTHSSSAFIHLFSQEKQEMAKPQVSMWSICFYILS